MLEGVDHQITTMLDLQDLIFLAAGAAGILVGLAIGVAWGRRRERIRGILAYAPDSELMGKRPARGNTEPVELLR